MATFAELSEPILSKINKFEKLKETGGNEEIHTANTMLPRLHGMLDRLKQLQEVHKAKKTQREIEKFAKKNPEAAAQMQQQIQQQMMAQQQAQMQQSQGQNPQEEQAEGVNSNLQEEGQEQQIMPQGQSGMRDGGSLPKFKDGYSNDMYGQLGTALLPTAYNLMKYNQNIEPNVVVSNMDDASTYDEYARAMGSLGDIEQSIKNQGPVSFNTAKRASANARKIDLENAQNAVGPERYNLQVSATTRDAERGSNISEAEYNTEQQRQLQKAQSLSGLAGQRVGIAGQRNQLGAKNREIEMFYQDLMAKKQAAKENYLKTAVEAGSMAGQQYFTNKIGLQNMNNMSNAYNSSYSNVVYNPKGGANGTGAWEQKSETNKYLWM